MDPTIAISIFVFNVSFSLTTFFLDALARVGRKIQKSLKRMYSGPEGRKWQRIIRWVGEGWERWLVGSEHVFGVTESILDMR